MNILVNLLFPQWGNQSPERLRSPRPVTPQVRRHLIRVKHILLNLPSVVGYDSFSQPTFLVDSRVIGTRRVKSVLKGYIN